MKAAAVAIGGGCGVDLLRAAKKAGCPAFRQGRIDIDDLRAWLATNPVDPSAIQTKEMLQVRKLTAECQRLERENKVEDGELISLAEQIAISARVDADIWRAVDEGLGDAAKQGLVGVGTYAEVAVILEAIKDKIRSTLYAPPGSSPPPAVCAAR